MLPGLITCPTTRKRIFFSSWNHSSSKVVQLSSRLSNSPQGTEEGGTSCDSWPNPKLFTAPWGAPHVQARRTPEEGPPACAPPSWGQRLLRAAVSLGPVLTPHPLTPLFDPTVYGAGGRWACRHRGCKLATALLPRLQPRPLQLTQQPPYKLLWATQPPWAVLMAQASAKTLPEAICLHQFSFLKKSGSAIFK